RSTSDGLAGRTFWNSVAAAAKPGSGGAAGRWWEEGISTRIVARSMTMSHCRSGCAGRGTANRPAQPDLLLAAGVERPGRLDQPPELRRIADRVQVGVAVDQVQPVPVPQRRRQQLARV